MGHYSYATSAYAQALDQVEECLRTESLLYPIDMWHKYACITPILFNTQAKNEYCNIQNMDYFIVFHSFRNQWA